MKIDENKLNCKQSYDIEKFNEWENVEKENYGRDQQVSLCR